jgi:hypothetical protein
MAAAEQAIMEIQELQPLVEQRNLLMQPQTAAAEALMEKRVDLALSLFVMDWHREIHIYHSTLILVLVLKHD